MEQYSLNNGLNILLTYSVLFLLKLIANQVRQFYVDIGYAGDLEKNENGKF